MKGASEKKGGMRKLTIGRVAGAGLRTDGRGYISLAAGIFLSIYLMSAMCLCFQGVLLMQEEKRARRFGYEDCLILNDSATDEELTETGFFGRIGHIRVVGRAEGSEMYLGYYDSEGEALMNRRCSAGRMPEAAGELAAEQSALDILEIEAAPGDSITLRVEPIDGASEEREYTLVGILEEQTSYLRTDRTLQTGMGVTAMPALIVSGADAPFQTGREVVHRAATLSRMTTHSGLLKYAYPKDGWSKGWLLLGVSAGGIVVDNAGLAAFDQESSQTLLLIGLLGGALALSVCVGISTAMEGRLERRSEQIAMLRAVGATSRQIRRIFGREAWLLAGAVSLPAVGAGILTGWLISLMAPESFLFRPSPLLIAPIFALSVLSVVLSSWFPLLRASRVMPMRAMRDTGLMRKGASFKPKKRFRPARLIALRQARLHPGRPVGAALLEALMVFSMLLFMSACFSSFGGEFADRPDITLYSAGSIEDGMFSENGASRGLTKRDIDQISSLSAVKSVKVLKEARINLVCDSVPAFFLNEEYTRNAPYLLSEEAYKRWLMGTFQGRFDGALTEDDVDTSYWQRTIEEHDAARDALSIGRDKTLLPVPIRVLALSEDALSPFVSSGRIDMRALDEGREILAYAPDLYKVDAGSASFSVYNEPRGYAEYERVENDSYAAGQTLTLLRAFNRQRSLFGFVGGDYDFWYPQYANMEKTLCEVSVGAILKGELFAKLGFSASDPCLITTDRGAAALGISAERIADARIFLTDGADRETEDFVSNRVETIALRAADIRVFNQIESERANESYTRGLTAVLLGCVALFFAVTVSMIAGGVTRRVRADTRTIGMLRAVGADARVIAGCYRPQIAVSVLSGLALGLAAGLLLWRVTAYPFGYQTLILMCGAALAGACYVVCLLVLRARVKETIGHGVVESIREL